MHIGRICFRLNESTFITIKGLHDNIPDLVLKGQGRGQREYENKKNELDSKIEILLLPKDPNDGKNVVVEIRGAAGGDEGNIFAGDLFDMYKKLSEKEGWNIELLDEERCEAGGYSLISFVVKGTDVKGYPLRKQLEEFILQQRLFQ